MVIPLDGSPANVVPFPFIMQPLTQITPFSYRDGMTYAKTLEEFGWYLTESVIPEFNTKMDEILANFQAGITNAETTIINTKAEWQALFDAFMAAINEELAALNDAAVSELVNDPESLTGDALRDNFAPVHVADPDSYFDNIKVVAKFPVREAGELLWLQGFSINKDANEIYTSSQDGTQMRIDVRDLTTGIRKSSKNIVTENLAYTESLDWFYAGTDLCFIVWPKAMAFPSQYAIYNYTQGTLSAGVNIQGIVRGSRSGDIFVTTDVWGTNSAKYFYIYSWQSIKNGGPVLLDTIEAENWGSLAAKNQGIAVVGNKIFFAMGDQTEQPTFMRYGLDGSLQDNRNYSRAEFARALNVLVPGAVTNDAYLYEAEGAYALDGKLLSMQIVNNNPAVTADGVAYIIEHGAIDGERMTPSRPTLKAITAWKDVPLLAGWVASTGGPLQVRRNKNRIEFRGFASNPTFVSAAGYTDISGPLPDNLPGPRDYYKTTPISGSTTSVRSGRIQPSTRVISVQASAATSAWYGMEALDYSI